MLFPRFTPLSRQWRISDLRPEDLADLRSIMESLSSEDDERCSSYCLSADISESESSSSFSGTRFESSMASSPLGFRPIVGNCSFPAPPALVLPAIGGRDCVLWDEKSQKSESELSEIELMKERFAKLLLGEDMSGGGKGVCTALAISNAITNLAASVFGELWRLEPLAAQRKKMWCREMEWLLCVSDSIVELVPEMQEIQGVGTFEIMATRPRSDLYVNMGGLCSQFGFKRESLIVISQMLGGD